MKVAHLRYPKTVAEIRANKHLVADVDMLNLGVVVRPKRLALPTERDDQSKGTFRSWKNYRATQYK